MVIEETSTWLKDWVDDTVGDQLAILGPPQAGERRTKGRGVALYLLDVTPTAPPNGARRQRLEVEVRYLITAWAAEPLDAHTLLSQLLFSAMQNTDLEVALQPPSMDVWRGFGMPPQPAFVVRCRAWKDLTPRAARPVTRRVFDVYVGVARKMTAAAREGRPAFPAAVPTELCLHLDRR